MFTHRLCTLFGFSQNYPTVAESPSLKDHFEEHIIYVPECLPDLYLSRDAEDSKSTLGNKPGLIQVPLFRVLLRKKRSVPKAQSLRQLGGWIHERIFELIE